MCTDLCMHVSLSPKEGTISLYRCLQAIMYYLRIEFWTPGRMVNVVNHRAISSAPDDVALLGQPCALVHMEAHCGT